MNKDYVYLVDLIYIGALYVSMKYTYSKKNMIGMKLITPHHDDKSNLKCANLPEFDRFEKQSARNKRISECTY